MIKGTILPYEGNSPQLAEEVYISEGAFVIGNVALGRGSSVWFNTVIRGDENHIRIGSYTNIQDGSVLHVGHEKLPTIVGDNVTVGHNVILHGCTVGNNCLIGMGAIVLNEAEIGDNSIVGAGSLVTERKKFPPNSLLVGSPAKVVRTLSEEDIAAISQSAVHYFKLAQKFR